MSINESFSKIIKTINRLRTPIRVFVIDGSDERVVKAKSQLNAETEFIEVILGDDSTVKSMSDATREEMMRVFKERTASKFSDSEREQNIEKIEYIAVLMYLIGRIDAIIGGANKSVVETINAAYRVLGPKQQNGLISTYTWLNNSKRSLFFADTHFLPEPTAEMMAKIAYDTSVSIATNFHIRPSVAMISYSTDGSGGNANADQIHKVRLATKMTQDIGIEAIGEVQLDVAFDEKARKAKMPNHIELTKPNIFVFPNLTAANASYLAAREMGGWSSVGPIVNGLNGVVNLVTKTSSVFEIVFTMAISAFISLNSRDLKELQEKIIKKAKSNVPKPDKAAKAKDDKKAKSKDAKEEVATTSTAIAIDENALKSASAELDELKIEDIKA